MAERLGNEIFGRPQLVDVLTDQRAPNTTIVVAQMLLRASPLLQLMPVVARATVDAAAGVIALPYQRRTIARVGQTRDYNADYAAKFTGGATDHTAIVRPFGDAFEADRAFGTVGDAWIESNVNAMAPGVLSRVADLVVNGQPAVNSREIEGLNVIATREGRVRTGLTLAIADGNTVNLALRRQVQTLAAAVDELREQGFQPVIISNRDFIGAIDLVGDALGYTNRTLDFFGQRQVQTFAGAPLIAAGTTAVYGAPVADALGRQVYPVNSAEIIPTADDAGTPVTDVYVVGFSNVNGVTAVTVNGQNDTTPVRYATPAGSPGAVRRWEVEMLLGLAALSANSLIKFEDVRLR